MRFVDYGGLTFDDVLIAPEYSDIESRDEIDLSQDDFLGLYLEVPIISANMDYVTGSDMAIAMYEEGGLGILNRFIPWEQQKEEMFKIELISPVILSVGIRNLEESIEKVKWAFQNLYNNKIIITIDVAHGHHQKVADLIKKIKDMFEVDIIAGNIATEDGAFFLIDAGADAIKVGIGPGSVCTTRTVTGVGVPQLGAIISVAREAHGNVKVIADGGIRSSGDIVKALVAGADAVMLGYLLAGADEAPGVPMVGPDGTTKWKPYRGQSIFGSSGERYTKEGISGYVRERGPVARILKELVGGIRSGMSYVGARNLTELREKAYFIKVSGHTMHENNTRVSEVVG